jgi:hypothetical protein
MDKLWSEWAGAKLKYPLTQTSRGGEEALGFPEIRETELFGVM